MAAKKGKTSRKYKQAKQAAKPAAKAAFSGKKQASRKDPKIKISAEDKMALKDMKDTAKADLGKNAYLSKAEYNATQAKAREAFRESMRTEFGEYGGKKASATETAMKETKAGGKTTKPKAKAKFSAKGPSLVENGKVVSKARAEEIMSGKRGKNFGKYGALDEYVIEKNLEKEEKAKSSATKKTTKKAAVKKAAPSKPSVTAAAKSATVAEPATKPSTKKPSPKKKAATKKTSTPKVTRPTDASLTKMEDDYINKTREKLIKQGKLSGSKEVAIRPKGEVVSKAKPVVRTATAKPIPGSDTVVKKKGLLRKIGGKFVPVVAAGELVSAAKGSTFKDLSEIDRLKAKLGDKRMSAKEGAATQASNLANLLTMGAVGQTRRERMDELNAKIKKKAAATKKANKGLRYGADGSSLVPGTAAYKAGSKTRPVKPVAPGAAGGASGGKSGTTTGAGGSTITATPGSTYTVKKGDTLSAIAKASGVSLTEIRKANKKFTTNPKYKQGSMIWSGTKVNIPKK